MSNHSQLDVCGWNKSAYSQPGCIFLVDHCERFSTPRHLLNFLSIRTCASLQPRLWVWSTSSTGSHDFSPRSSDYSSLPSSSVHIPYAILIIRSMGVGLFFYLRLYHLHSWNLRKQTVHLFSFRGKAYLVCFRLSICIQSTRFLALPFLRSEWRQARGERVGTHICSHSPSSRSSHCSSKVVCRNYLLWRWHLQWGRGLFDMPSGLWYLQSLFLFSDILLASFLSVHSFTTPNNYRYSRHSPVCCYYMGWCPDSYYIRASDESFAAIQCMMKCEYDRERSLLLLLLLSLSLLYLVTNR